MESSKDKNYEYFRLNKQEPCRKYLRTKDKTIFDEYETFEEALKEARNIKAETHIIQKCEKNDKVQIFRTKVRFNG